MKSYSKYMNHVFSILISLFFYFYLFIFLILLFFSFICSFYFLFTGERFPLSEIEDSAIFNIIFKDVAQGMLYDMSKSQENIRTTIPSPFIQMLQSKTFLDIGSGGGTASIHHLQNFFGKDVNIILSDLYPKPELWEKIKTEHVTYISEPTDAKKIPYSLLSDSHAISLFGSLHHMDKETIHTILSNIRDGRPDYTKSPIPIFIIEPTRFSRIIQFLHILLLPLFGFPMYFFICLFGGSGMNAESVLNNITRILFVPFFMTLDHILGASRRYSYEEINEMARENGFSTIKHSDMIFDYYIIYSK